MSIEKQEDGRYLVRWRDSDGKQRSRTVYRQRDAITLDGEIKRKKAMGELIAHERGAIKLVDFWEVWWEKYASSMLTPRTRDTYRRLWKKHLAPSLGSRALKSITTEHVAALIASLSKQLSPASVRQCAAILQGLLQRAVEWRYVPTNPAIGVKKPKLVQRRGRALSAEQVAKLCSELDARSRAIASTLSATGLRPGELRQLRWSAVSRETLEVYASKTNSRRAVDLRDEARRTLLEWWVASGQPDDDQLIFPSADGSGPWTDNGYRLWVRQTFKPAALRAGLGDVRPYDLRHTFVTTLIYERRPPQEVARQAGHSLVVCLTTYAQEFESVPSECDAKVDTTGNLRARLGI